MKTINLLLFLSTFSINVFSQSHDIGIQSIITPTSNCELPSKEIIEIQLVNYGLSKIDSGTVFLSYTYNGQIYFDTLKQVIDTNQSVNFIFTDSLALLNSTQKHELQINISLSGDSNLQNNRLARNIYSTKPSLPYYHFDFEDMEVGSTSSNDNLLGWKRNSSTGYHWHVQKGASPYYTGTIKNTFNLMPTGPSGDKTFANQYKNGDGKYMVIESALDSIPTVVNDATLELPCDSIDLSNSINNSIIMSFFYHKFGANCGDLFVDVFNGTQWNQLDVIRGETQFNSKDSWKRREVLLNSYAGMSNIKIRLRAEFNGISGQIGIDEIEITDRPLIDARFERIIEPLSDCSLGTNERFRVQLKNTGTDDILETILGYQQTFIPLFGTPIVSSVIKDTAVGVSAFMAPLSYKTFEFNRLDLSVPGTYQFKVWTEINGDTNYFNDTLSYLHTVTNYTKPLDYCENFSDYELGDSSTELRSGQFPSGWKGHHSFATFVADSTFDTLKGHTGNSNDNVLVSYYRIETSCYNIDTNSSLLLNFWFQNMDSNNTIYIDYKPYSTTGWNTIDSISNSQTAANWTKKEVYIPNLNNNTNYQFRFRLTNPSKNYFALDDVCVLSPLKKQINALKINEPAKGLCAYFESEEVNLTAINIGTEQLDSFQVVLNVDTLNQIGPKANYFKDTLSLFPLNFMPGDTLSFSLNDTNFKVDMTRYLDYYLSIELIAKGDSSSSLNFLSNYIVKHSQADSIPSEVDFESIDGEGTGPTYSNGFIAENYKYTKWTEKKGVDVLGSEGPLNDHTKKDSTGVYMVIQNSPLRHLPKTVKLESTCIDIHNANNPSIEYYAFMFGTNIGQLKLEVNYGSSWVVVDSLNGQQQATQTAPWLRRYVNLQNNQGDILRYRFVSIPLNGNSGHHVAVDDISVRDLLLTRIDSKIASNETVNISPNPTSGTIRIELSSDNLNQAYQIYDIQGKVLKIGYLNDRLTRISLLEFDKGIYFLKLEKSGLVKKLIKY